MVAVDAVVNPYAPGAGQRPPELAGRDPELSQFGVMLDRLQAGRAERGVVLTGLRGVGKTVLLEELRAKAEERRWVAAFVEAGTDRAFPRPRGRERSRRRYGPPLGGIAHRRGCGGRWECSSRSHCKAHQTGRSAWASKSIGWPAGRTLATLSWTCATCSPIWARRPPICEQACCWQSTNSKSCPAPISRRSSVPRTRQIGCGSPWRSRPRGLPNLPALLVGVKTYSERLFSYRRIGALSATDGAEALRRPAEALQVAWQSDALGHAVESSGGYPYFLQVFGKQIWDFAAGPGTISLTDAQDGVAAARPRSRRRLLRHAPWERATPAQRTYLLAMAAEAGGADVSVSTGRLARRLGRSHSDLGPYPRPADPQGPDLRPGARPSSLHRPRHRCLHQEDCPLIRSDGRLLGTRKHPRRVSPSPCLRSQVGKRVTFGVSDRPEGPTIRSIAALDRLAGWRGRGEGLAVHLNPTVLGDSSFTRPSRIGWHKHRPRFQQPSFD